MIWLVSGLVGVAPHAHYLNGDLQRLSKAVGVRRIGKFARRLSKAVYKKELLNPRDILSH